MRKFVKCIIILILAGYAINILINQQLTLNSYAAESEEYKSQIEAANEEQQELYNTIQDLNSTEYIENQAREQLDMYLPNERVYIDITK